MCHIQQIEENTKASLMSVPVVNCPIIWKIPLNKEDKESFNA